MPILKFDNQSKWHDPHKRIADHSQVSDEEIFYQEESR